MIPQRPIRHARTLVKLYRAFETVAITPLDRQMIDDRAEILGALSLALEAIDHAYHLAPRIRKDGREHPERTNGGTVWDW